MFRVTPIVEISIKGPSGGSLYNLSIIKLFCQNLYQKWNRHPLGQGCHFFPLTHYDRLTLVTRQVYNLFQDLWKKFLGFMEKWSKNWCKNVYKNILCRCLNVPMFEHRHSWCLNGHCRWICTIINKVEIVSWQCYKNSWAMLTEISRIEGGQKVSHRWDHLKKLSDHISLFCIIRSVNIYSFWNGRNLFQW